MTSLILVFTIMLCFLPLNLAYAQSSMDLSIKDDQVHEQELKHDVKSSFGKGRKKNPSYAKNRGMVSTGLSPKFDDKLIGRGIDEAWAMDYSFKRGREAYHGGIDIPAPKGTPILAVASGIVVAKYMNLNNPKGIEIIIRHAPKDTALPVWIYSQYTHLLKMPHWKIGQKINMGDVIGQTSNSGISGKEAKKRHGTSMRQGKKTHSSNKVRRDALHLGVFYSSSKKYAKNAKTLIPVDAYWMDPNALYKTSAPYDSKSLRALPQAQKNIFIPCMLDDGETFPKVTKVIWPYYCKRK